MKKVIAITVGILLALSVTLTVSATVIADKAASEKTELDLDLGSITDTIGGLVGDISLDSITGIFDSLGGDLSLDGIGDSLSGLVGGDSLGGSGSSIGSSIESSIDPSIDEETTAADEETTKDPDSDTKDIVYPGPDTNGDGKLDDKTIDIENGKTITIDPGKGDWTPDDDKWTKNADGTYSRVVDDDLTIKNIPTREGYVFGGWNAVKDDDGNVTLTAIWNTPEDDKDKDNDKDKDKDNGNKENNPNTGC